MKKLVSCQTLIVISLLMLFSCTGEDTPIPDVNTDSSVLIKVAVKIEIGNILYENLDAHLRVTGYNANNQSQWKKDFEFVGPFDTLDAKSGFHHYSIELVDKWGINDLQSDIPLKDFLHGRADGTQPVTYVLGGSKKAKRLSFYVTSREVNRPDGIVYHPESRVSYTYHTDGKLQNIHHEIYNSQTSQFEENSAETFAYGADGLRILTVLNGNPYSEYHYEYGNGFGENKITVINYFDNNKTWTMTSARDGGNDKVTANYSYSNGSSFLYQFNVIYKNIASDKTIRQTELCSYKSLTYDKNINPFRHLGYVDFNFENWSSNNKLTEDAHYQACGFPVLIPVSHVYTYDADGYPVKKITTYKGGSFDGQTTTELPLHSKIDFSYE